MFHTLAFTLQGVPVAGSVKMVAGDVTSSLASPRPNLLHFGVLLQWLRHDPTLHEWAVETIVNLI